MDHLLTLICSVQLCGFHDIHRDTFHKEFAHQNTIGICQARNDVYPEGIQKMQVSVQNVGRMIPPLSTMVVMKNTMMPFLKGRSPIARM